MTTKFGALEEVPVRDLWADEARDFTPWLAKRADLLSNELGLDLVHEQSEAPVGAYSADLLFRESEGQLVVVENMFGTTDHDHLGKLITYMAGLGARYAVLVAEVIRPEHQSALNHLNSISGDAFGFFGIVLRVRRIGDSRPAPELRLEVHPDNWRRTVKATQDATPAEKRNLRFWDGLLEALRDTYPGWTQRNPSKDSWISLPSAAPGVATYHPAIGANRVRVEVYIDTRDSTTTKRVFDYLYDRKKRIEKEIGEALEWDRLDDNKWSRVTLRSVKKINEEEQWAEVQQWFVDALGKLRDTFDPHLESCRATFDNTEVAGPTETASVGKRKRRLRLAFWRQRTVD